MKKNETVIVLGCKNWAKELINILNNSYNIITAGEEKSCDIKLSFDLRSNWQYPNIPPLYGLLNIGKITELNGLVETPANKWKSIVNENLQIIYKSINFFSKFIKSEGSIVNILEIGQMEGLGGALIYDAYKKESDVLTKSLAYKLAEQKVRVNSIRAGYIDTEEENGAANKLKEIYIKNAEKLIPLKKIGTIEDIANLVDFLLSKKSILITGNVISMDGGISTKG